MSEYAIKKYTHVSHQYVCIDYTETNLITNDHALENSHFEPKRSPKIELRKNHLNQPNLHDFGFQHVTPLETIMTGWDNPHFQSEIQNFWSNYSDLTGPKNPK